MGFYFTFSVFNNTEAATVQEELRKFACEANGGLEHSNVNHDDPNFCSILVNGSHTIVSYPEFFTEYIQSSKSLSKSLQNTIYTFSIYDGVYWMLYIFEKGIYSSRFNPYPSYWSDKEAREQVETWNFRLDKLYEDFHIPANSIDNYFIEWKGLGEKTKAYEDDEFNFGDGDQVFDLLRHLSVTYSDIINYEKEGTTFNLWTSKFPLKENNKITFDDIQKAKRYSLEPIRLSDSEIEYILGVRVNFFIEYLENNQNCTSCKTFSNKDQMEITDYYLSLKGNIIKAIGCCKKCGNRIESGFGISSIKKLFEVLNS